MLGVSYNFGVHFMLFFSTTISKEKKVELY